MSTRKKKQIVDNTEEAAVVEETREVEEAPKAEEAIEAPEAEEIVEAPKAKEPAPAKAPKKKEEPVVAIGPKFAVGSIVFIGRDADTDLEGFKLFPQYKKYAYTVEAYNDHTGVYTLRRLNLSLKLKEAQILAPSERAHDKLNRAQY